MKGRKPKPVELKLVTGNPGKRPLKRPPRTDGRAALPQWLSPEAANEWRRLAPRLAALDLLTPADRAFFAAYCEAFATWRKANGMVAEQGELVLDPDGVPVKNPWLRVRDAAAAELRQFGSEFGLSPAARARLGGPANEGTKEDPAERYFG